MIPKPAEVSVVIIDLEGVILDEQYGAIALERTIEAIESWGADAIITGLSPLSANVVADLERPPLVEEKGLAHAIALAFQITQAQRCVV